LLNRFDLVVSWQVLEHVADVPNALENIRSYLRPGGTMVIMFSGRWSLFAIAGRAIPFSLGKPIVSRIMKRSPTLGPVFPAHYDQCYDSALRRLLEAWGTSEIHPYFRGAAYLNFSAITFACYLRYENVVATRRVANLATHYLVVAEKQ
jgi:SAM-dependent methyltransferase